MRLLHLPVLVHGWLALLSGPLVSRAMSDAATAIQLEATLTSPVDVALQWTDAGTGAEGYIVEFAYQPDGPFTILDFRLPHEKSYVHPDLIPETKFYYRIRPVYGRSSKPVEAQIAADLSDEEYAKQHAAQQDYRWAEPQTIPGPMIFLEKSLRDRATASNGAPSNLRVKSIPPTVSGFRFTWTDRALDEEGFLLETKADGEQEFRVCAMYQPNINAIEWPLEPPQRRASFRVRAYYFGEPSNMVWKHTGKEPPAAKPAPSDG
jgi:hypothetical protein